MINIKRVILFLLLILFLIQPALASKSFIERSAPIKAADINIPVGKGSKTISLLQLSTITKVDRKINRCKNWIYTNRFTKYYATKNKMKYKLRRFCYK